MSWLDEPFPECISYGAMSAPMWQTTIATNQGGYEQRNQDWTQARHEFDLSFAIRTRTDYMLVLKHWHMARGQFHSFGFTDPLDSTVLAGEGVAGYVSPGVAQLFKRYGSGAYLWDRKITRPKAGAVIRRFGGVAAAGAAPGQYALDLNTGQLTFVPDQTRTINSHTPGASHILVLASAFSPTPTVGSYVGLSGITGTAAATLNGNRFQVLSVVGATVTIDVTTTGLTAAGGTAALGAQPSEITWSGEFMVPVRYGMASIPAVAANRKSTDELLVSVDGVSCVEVRE